MLRNDQFKDNTILNNETNHNKVNVDRFLGWLLVCEDCLVMGVTLGNRKHNQNVNILLLKQIFTYDIRPEGDNPYRTLGCKLGSDWLKFHSIGAELTITRSLGFQDFYIPFNASLWFIVLLIK